MRMSHPTFKDGRGSFTAISTKYANQDWNQVNVVTNENKFTFTSAFWPNISERALEMATKNRTAYVIESLLKGSAVADQVRASLQAGEAALQEAIAARQGGSESILSVSNLMAFSGKSKKSAVKAGKKAKVTKKNAAKNSEEEIPKKTRKSSRLARSEKAAEKPVLRRSTRARKGTI